MWHALRSRSHMHRASFCIALALACTTPALAHAQLLDRASSAVRDEPDQDQGSDARDDQRNDDDDDDDDDSGRLGRASRSVRGSDAYGQAGEPSGPRRHWDSGSPYFNMTSNSSYLVSTTGAPPPEESGLLHLTTRVALEGGVVLPADPIGVGRLGASMRMQLPIGLEIGARYSIFIEPRGGRTDSIALGRFAIDWRLVTEEFMQFRLGAALRHFHDRAGDLFGADIEAGLDFFPVDPLILSFEANVGFIENALVVQARGSLGFLLGIVEITLGWNYEGLFGAQNVDLGGPMAGVRFWL